MQIDLEPGDYRAEPVKGEPIFGPHGVLKIIIFIGFFALLYLSGFVLRPVKEWLLVHAAMPAICSTLPGGDDC